MSIIVAKNGHRVVQVFDNTYDKDVEHVAMLLRQEDFNEVFASTGEHPYDAIMEGWKMSTKRWLIFNEKGEPVAVLGVRPTEMFGDVGIPWLLGTDGLTKMKKFFMKISKPIIEEMKESFEILVNYVDSRYVKTTRWLDWCGFIVEDAEPFGKIGLPFHRFYMETN